MLQSLQGSSEWGKQILHMFSRKLYKKKITSRSRDIFNQQPISPVKLALPNELDGDLKRLYDYIVQHFVATFFDNCFYCTDTITFQIGTEMFEYSWKSSVFDGFTVIIPWNELSQNKPTGLFQKYDICHIKDVRK